MRIAIVAAMEEELAPFVGGLEGAERVACGPLEAWVGWLDGAEVACATIGIGTVSAAVGVTTLCGTLECDAVACSGVAGAVSDDLAPGDLVVATRVIDADYGRATDAGRVLYRPGAVPLPGIEPGDPAFKLDPALEQAVRERLGAISLPPTPVVPGAGPRIPTIHVGTIATTDAFVASEAVRDAIGRDTGAVALEMEGAAVAAVAERFGVPWLLVRAISDRAGTDSGLDFTASLPGAAANAATVLRTLLPLLRPANGIS